MNRYVFYKTTIPTRDQDEDLMLDLEHLVRALRKELMKYHGMETADRPMPMVFLNDSIFEDEFGTLSLEELTEQVEAFFYDRVKADRQEGRTEESAVEKLLDDLIFSLHHKQMLLANGAGIRLRWIDVNQEVLRKIREIRQDPNQTEEEKAQLDHALSLLMDWKKVHLRLGEFLPDHNIIVIYYQAIREYIATAKQLNRDLDFNTVVFAVLAREMYQTYTDEKHKFPMSDLYTLHYLIKSGKEEAMEVAKYRFREWGENLFNSWPYSKAMLLLQENGELPEFSKEAGFYEKTAERRRGADLERLFAFEDL